MANTVTLHGKLYDATTGKAIDGFVKPPGVKHKSPHSSQHVTAQAVHERTQHAKTLARSIVRKPGQLHRKPLEKPAPTTSISASLPSATQDYRHIQAHDVVRSSLISRFNDGMIRQKLVTKTHALPVKPEPLEQIAHHQAPPIIPVAAAPTQNMFSAAISQSTSHLAPALSAKAVRKRRRSTSKHAAFTVSAALAVVVLLGGYFAWQNSANVAFRVAASRAGIQASLPSYRPSGYAMSGPLEFAPGQITVRFTSTSRDQRSFSITQKTSNWDSRALLENFVVTSSQRDYQSLQSKGRTVFIYNNGNATWVDGGIWYQIESESNLNTEQLLSIAATM